VSACGAITQEEVVTIVRALFGSLARGKRPALRKPKPGGGFVKRALAVRQIYFLLGFASAPIIRREYLYGLLAASILGQGNSSRLFQSMREEKGLCYDIEAHTEGYRDAGALLITGTFERKNLKPALDVLRNELQSLLKHEVPKDEFTRAIEMICAQLEMEQDSIRSRLWRLVESELALGRYVSCAQAIEKLHQLTARGLRRYLQHYVGERKSLLVLGGDVRGVREISF
jgi:predicted Zn-dependent peptidase